MIPARVKMMWRSIHPPCALIREGIMTATPRILVVSPHAELLELFDTIMSSEGYAVHCSPQGRLDPALTQSVDPSLIIFAPSFPVPDPYEAVQSLRSDTRTSSIPVLVCASPCPDASVEKLHSIGCENLPLPFDLESFYRAAHGLIPEQDASDDEPEILPYTFLASRHEDGDTTVRDSVSEGSSRLA
jgi:CheY-like chemotaxis protein